MDRAARLPSATALDGDAGPEGGVAAGEDPGAVVMRVSGSKMMRPARRLHAVLRAPGSQKSPVWPMATMTVSAG